MFIEERLLDCASYGTQYGSAFNTAVVTLNSGHERRNAQWEYPQGKFNIVFNSLKQADQQKVQQAFYVCRGRWAGFRLKNFSDYLAENQPLGLATGQQQTLQLMVSYQFGNATFERPIKKPVAGTVKLFANGVEIAAQLDHTTGLISFIATDGAVLTWSGEYDIPVRFDNDDIQWSVDNRSPDSLILGTDISLTEIRL